MNSKRRVCYKKVKVAEPVLTQDMLTGKASDTLYRAFVRVVRQCEDVNGNMSEERGRRLISLLNACETCNRSLQAQHSIISKVALRLATMHQSTMEREQELKKRKKQFVLQCQQDLAKFLPLAPEDDDGDDDDGDSDDG